MSGNFPIEAFSHPHSSESFHLGMDLGSTTGKVVLATQQGDVLYSDYGRHRADVQKTLLSMLTRVLENAGDASVLPAFTGSAGMGLSERTGFQFIQEMVAVSGAVQVEYPDCGAFIDIGGEDGKLIFFNDHARPDMRMNGACAGGTGAFIDQMAGLMNVSVFEFDKLAQKGVQTLPIASRCGVFAKTDVQNLFNIGASRADIARSVFQAVAIQVVGSLARGREINGPVVFSGGPLYFFQSLRDAFVNVLSLSEDEVVLPENAHIYAAYGSALSADGRGMRICSLREVIQTIREKGAGSQIVVQQEKLFKDADELAAWTEVKDKYGVSRAPLSSADGKDVYLGIDAGSTTTKILLMDEGGRILFLHYSDNKGAPVESVRNGLTLLQRELDSQGVTVRIKRSCVTGYGEELVKSAFEIDEGLVETLAHYNAARIFNPEASFVLDIGGQDMKALFIRDGVIQNIEINEACSSGCGSFIETFAESSGYSAADFGRIACTAERPADLGTRCTVFMNSSVKQALRQGSGVADVAAGLAYSVIRNCLEKVLKVTDPSQLGEGIVVQGGTFKNPAVLRAMEKILGVDIIRPNIAEFMGAYGAAIVARKNAKRIEGVAHHESPIFRDLTSVGQVKERKTVCKACTNQCRIRILEFPNGRKHFTGARCERVFSNSGSPVQPGDNLLSFKHRLLLDQPTEPSGPASLTIGIPLVLNIYENYPFWAAFFTRLGIRVVHSSVRHGKYQTAGAGTIMSDNICYPAKLVHEHILDLIEQRVDRIFYPLVVYEKPQFRDSANHFNCPIVTGYPDVVKSSIVPDCRGVPLDSPNVSFHDETLLRKACREYARRFNVTSEDFREAFAAARLAMADHKNALREAGGATINKAKANNRLMVVLAGRPYHVDPSVHHGVPDMISKMGIHVLSCDALPLDEIDLPEPLEVADQWEYSNRLYRAAHWVGREAGAEFVQLNSFGCGPDAVTIDEVKAILKTYGKSPVVLKIDEISSLGSARLRVRSMVESRPEISGARTRRRRPRLPLFQKEDRRRTILVPDFSPFYSFVAQSIFTPLGYKVDILPPPDDESVKLALKYANNDICYPALVVIGDILKALKSGKYNPEDVAVALTETGGQCRASNYTPLLKKALLNAGIGDIPVVSAGLSKESLNSQPGFKLNRPRVVSLIFSGLLVVDQLIRMYHATAVREKIHGDSLSLLKKYLYVVRSRVGKWTVQDAEAVLLDAVRGFNGVDVRTGEYPKAGLIGEIYVKYNPFSNGNIVEKLINEGIEATVPPLITFFMQTFINREFNQERHISSSSPLTLKSLQMLEKIVDWKISRINEITSGFKLGLSPMLSIRTLAGKAAKVLDLSNQYGEGWLLPGEVVAMADAGIRNILCLQPFGCIANHIVAKGVAATFQRMYPDLNYLALDMDAGNSDANIENRLAFFIHSTKESAQRRPDIYEEEKKWPDRRPSRLVEAGRVLELNSYNAALLR